MASTTDPTSEDAEKEARWERRGSHRYFVSGQRREGFLKIGDRELVTEILDESATGLSVLIDAVPDLEVGQSVFLRIAAGWVEAQVMNLQVQEASTSSPNDSNANPQVRLGLMRLRDVEASEVEPDGPTPLTRDDLKSLAQTLRPLLRPLACLAGLIVGIPLFAVILVRTLEFSLSVEPVVDGVARRTSARPASHPDAIGPLAVRPDTTQAAAKPQRRSHSNAAGREVADRSAEPAFRPRPEVTRFLALDRHQLRQLCQVFDGYLAAADTVTVANPGEVAPQNSRQRDIQFGRMGLSVLSERQAGSLMRMLLRPEVLLKPEVTKLLALSEKQLDDLGKAFAEYQATVGGAAGPDVSSPAKDLDPAVQLGRRGLAILTEEQHGRLMHLLSMPHLLDGPDPAGDPAATKESA